MPFFPRPRPARPHLRPCPYTPLAPVLTHIPASVQRQWRDEAAPPHRAHGQQRVGRRTAAEPAALLHARVPVGRDGRCAGGRCVAAVLAWPWLCTRPSALPTHLLPSLLFCALTPATNTINILPSFSPFVPCTKSEVGICMHVGCGDGCHVLVRVTVPPAFWPHDLLFPTLTRNAALGRASCRHPPILRCRRGQWAARRMARRAVHAAGSCALVQCNHGAVQAAAAAGEADYARLTAHGCTQTQTRGEGGGAL
mmetsp:Transcript_6375/g.19769  ORF Transcript_6375/g.19769 Transcript_6375/m.19769 type:complete len:253 (-) Transcript_6375:303-1061(-)